MQPHLKTCGKRVHRLVSDVEERHQLMHADWLLLHVPAGMQQLSAYASAQLFILSCNDTIQIQHGSKNAPVIGHSASRPQGLPQVDDGAGHGPQTLLAKRSSA